MNTGNFWGELIVQLRKEAKITQRQLSKGAGVNRSTLRRVEEGRTSADIDMMSRVLDYLGYELEILLKESKLEVLRRRAGETVDPTQRSRLAAASLLAVGPIDLQ